jgi:hypothetical protein
VRLSQLGLGLRAWSQPSTSARLNLGRFPIQAATGIGFGVCFWLLRYTKLGLHLRHAARSATVSSSVSCTVHRTSATIRRLRLAPRYRHYLSPVVLPADGMITHGVKVSLAAHAKSVCVPLSPFVWAFKPAIYSGTSTEGAEHRSLRGTATLHFTLNTSLIGWPVWQSGLRTGERRASERITPLGQASP